MDLRLLKLLLKLVVAVVVAEKAVDLLLLKLPLRPLLVAVVALHLKRLPLKVEAAEVVLKVVAPPKSNPEAKVEAEAKVADLLPLKLLQRPLLVEVAKVANLLLLLNNQRFRLLLSKVALKKAVLLLRLPQPKLSPNKQLLRQSQKALLPRHQLKKQHQPKQHQPKQHQQRNTTPKGKSRVFTSRDVFTKIFVNVTDHILHLVSFKL